MPPIEAGHGLFLVNQPGPACSLGGFHERGRVISISFVIGPVPPNPFRLGCEWVPAWSCGFRNVRLQATPNHFATSVRENFRFARYSGGFL